MVLGSRPSEREEHRTLKAHARGWGRIVHRCQDHAGLDIPALKVETIGKPAPQSPGDGTMEKQELVFEEEKETKNTVRYAEKSEGTPPVVGTIYVQKWALAGGIPKKVKVTLEAAE
jgi:hypothetical protein